ncbi:MAG: glycosyltransferase family 4 protein [Egibacteraceae bacterium]
MEASPQSGGGTRVVMLVQNDITYDTRVRKEAESLNAHGYEVHVLGHGARGLPSREIVSGVSYHRLTVPRGLASLGLSWPRSRHSQRGSPAGEVPPLESVTRNRQKVVAAVSPVSRHTGWALATRATLAALRPAVVHAHDLDSTLAAWLHLRRHAGTRLISDAHELELHRNAAWTRWTRAIASVLELQAIRRAHAVITVSPLIADDLAVKYNIARPAVILNSPRLETRSLAPALDLRAAAGLAPDEHLVVYVGGVLWRRGHEQLVAALGHLPSSVHAGVLGASSPEAEASLIAHASRLGVADRLHLFGAIAPEQVPSTLREGADATVIPIPNVCRSYDLALPNKLFDTVMAGVPVGVGMLAHMSQFVREQGVGLIFDERDPSSIASVITDLITGPRSRWTSAEHLDTLQRAVAWEVQEETLLSVYARLRPSDSSTSSRRS